MSYLVAKAPYLIIDMQNSSARQSKDGIDPVLNQALYQHLSPTRKMRRCFWGIDGNGRRLNLNCIFHIYLAKIKKPLPFPVNDFIGLKYDKVIIQRK
jgi:hypothetical protein